MDDRTVDDLRASLRAERDRTLHRLASLDVDHAGLVEASRSANLDDEHDPEGATVAFERAQLDAVTTAARQRLLDLDAALARVERGDYGRCAVCGRPIGSERLDARPTATRCIRHA